jgi:hypothetical protein
MGDDHDSAHPTARVGAMRKSRRPRQLRVLAAVVASLAGPAISDPTFGQEVDRTHRLRLAQGTDALQLAVAPTTMARPASQVSLSITLGPVGAVPRNSFVRVRGLPPAISLSEGYVTAPGAWSVPVSALSSLRLNVPVGVTGRTELGISLITEDGTLLAQARTILVIEPPPPPPPKEVTRESAKPVVPAAPQRAPVLSPADREAAERLVSRGEREAEQGNIAAARQFYLRSAQIGLARGAMLLAATYDPRELLRMGVRGVQPNVAEARKWYERARELGAPEADDRLARLGGG